MKDEAPFMVWTVHRHNDDRSDGPITEICGTRALADVVAEKSGWYGGNAPVNTRWAIRAGHAVYLLHAAEPINVAYSPNDLILAKEHSVRLSALSKLTPEERRVLNL